MKHTSRRFAHLLIHWMLISALLLLTFFVGTASAKGSAAPNTRSLASVLAQSGIPALDSDCTDGECVFAVSHSTDDSGPKPECGHATDWPEIYFGRCFSGGAYITSGFRFPSVTLNKNAPIVRAYLVFTVDGDYTNPVTVNFYGENSNNAQPFSDNSQPKDRPRLSGVSTTWPIALGELWSSGQAQQSPDITEIAQAIVNQANWTSGNALVILTETADTNLPLGDHRRVFAYDREGISYSARLVVKLAPPSPPPYSTSHYIVTTDAAKQNAAGCTEAQKGNRDILVVLDFGQPWKRGTDHGTLTLLRQLGVDNFASISQIENAAKAFLTGYWKCSASEMRLRLAIGTNNYGGLNADGSYSDGNYVTQAHGQAWAEMVQRVKQWISSHPCDPDPSGICDYSSRLFVRGATDIETWRFRDPNNPSNPNNGHAVRPQDTLNWVKGYDDNTTIPYYNYGSCEDCPTQGSPPEPVDPNDWTLDDFWYVSWGALTAYAVPEIYIKDVDTNEPVNANQWHYLSRYAATCRQDNTCLGTPRIPRLPNGRIRFSGTFTQWQRCGQLPANHRQCQGNNRPEEGWQQLFDVLYLDPDTRLANLRWSTDIIYDRP